MAHLLRFVLTKDFLRSLEKLLRDTIDAKGELGDVFVGAIVYVKELASIEHKVIFRIVAVLIFILIEVLL